MKVSKEKLQKWHNRIREIDKALEKNWDKQERLKAERRMLEEKIKCHGQETNKK